MKMIVIVLMFALSPACFAQKTAVEGVATDSSNGAFAIEIVINDTLSKIMKDPKNGRHKYLKMYQDPEFVVRTDSTGKFKINARLSDTIYFKSYGHKPEAHAVRDLIARKNVYIRLQPEATPKTE